MVLNAYNILLEPPEGQVRTRVANLFLFRFLVFVPTVKESDGVFVLYWYTIFFIQYLIVQLAIFDKFCSENYVCLILNQRRILIALTFDKKNDDLKNDN